MDPITSSVKVITASESPDGHRIATIVARYSRFFHSEVMTHKNFSRNASSSRAIPFRTMLKLTRKSMSAPIHWGKNEPGMQASQELTGFSLLFAKFMWYFTGHVVLTLAWIMSFSKVHKQIINRMIEPWTFINVQITATSWKNALELRIDNAAQPEFQGLASQIKEALSKTYYRRLKDGEWHLPWIKDDEWHLPLETLKKVSAARSARLSYTPIGDVKTNLSKDIELADRLWSQKHLSPFEHQATPKQGRHANLMGWMNYRTLKGF